MLIQRLYLLYRMLLAYVVSWALLIEGTLCNHFRGGTASWKYNREQNEVRGENEFSINSFHCAYTLGTIFVLSQPLWFLRILHVVVVFCIQHSVIADRDLLNACGMLLHSFFAQSILTFLKSQ